MNKTIKILNIVFGIIVALALLVLAFCWWANKYADLPSAGTTAYVNKIIDRHGVEYPFIEANYYSNDSGNGTYEVFELAFNFYTDPETKEVRSMGIQQIIIHSGGFSTPPIYNYYSRDNYGSYSEGDVQPIRIPMYIEIDGESYYIMLDQTYEEYTTRFGFGRMLSDVWGFILGKEPKDGVIGTIADVQTKHLDFPTFVAKNKNRLTRTTNGYGDYEMPLVDLATYFTIHKYNEETRQFKQVPYTEFNLSFFEVHVHKDRSAMLTYKQSMFGLINGEQMVQDGVGNGTDYWQHQYVKTISARDFDLRESPAEGGFLLKLSEAKLREFKTLSSDVVFVVDIDLDAVAFGGRKIIGLDFYAFAGLEIETLTIRSVAPVEFVLTEFSLSGATMLEIFTENVTLINKGVA